MCYMAVVMAASKKKRQVGVREMRQNLSVYLDRVKAGETLQVTEFGRVVALLTPLPAEKLSPLERMVREGRAIAPKGSLKDRRPPQPAQHGYPPIEQILAEEREDRVL
jgi:antitoxin (DNA-binding transcriptional repressor) of toxin-antitoxin stability system